MLFCRFKMAIIVYWTEEDPKTPKITLTNFYVLMAFYLPPWQDYLQRIGTAGGPFAFPHKRNNEKKPVAITKAISGRPAPTP